MSATSSNPEPQNLSHNHNISNRNVETTPIKFFVTCQQKNQFIQNSSYLAWSILLITCFRLILNPRFALSFFWYKCARVIIFFFFVTALVVNPFIYFYKNTGPKHL